MSRLLKALALDAILLSCFFVPSANAEPDRAGKVVAKGSDFLIDPNYQWNIGYQGTDELYSGKALLNSWIYGLPRKIGKS